MTSTFSSPTLPGSITLHPPLDTTNTTKRHPTGNPSNPRLHRRRHRPNRRHQRRPRIRPGLPNRLPNHLAPEHHPLPNRRPQLRRQLQLQRTPQQLPLRHRRLLLQRNLLSRPSIPRSLPRRLLLPQAMRRLHPHKRNLHLLRQPRSRPPHRLPTPPMPRVHETRPSGHQRGRRIGRLRRRLQHGHLPRRCRQRLRPRFPSHMSLSHRSRRHIPPPRRRRSQGPGNSSHPLPLRRRLQQYLRPTILPEPLRGDLFLHYQRRPHLPLLLRSKLHRLLQHRWGIQPHRTRIPRCFSYRRQYHHLQPGRSDTGGWYVCRGAGVRGHVDAH